jgi:hypothetical protein
LCHYNCHRTTKSNVLAHTQWLNVGSSLNQIISKVKNYFFSLKFQELELKIMFFTIFDESNPKGKSSERKMIVKKISVFTESEMKSKYKFEFSAKLQWKWNFYLWKWDEIETVFYTFSITNVQRINSNVKKFKPWISPKRKKSWVSIQINIIPIE